MKQIVSRILSYEMLDDVSVISKTVALVSLLFPLIILRTNLGRGFLDKRRRRILVWSKTQRVRRLENCNSQSPAMSRLKHFSVRTPSIIQSSLIASEEDRHETAIKTSLLSRKVRWALNKRKERLGEKNDVKSQEIIIFQIFRDLHHALLYVILELYKRRNDHVIL